VGKDFDGLPSFQLRHALLSASTQVEGMPKTAESKTLPPSRSLKLRSGNYRFALRTGVLKLGDDQENQIRQIKDKIGKESNFMKFVKLFSALVSVFIVSGTVSAQSKNAQSQEVPVYFSFSYAPIYQFETDLKGGGKFDVSRHFFRFDVLRPVNRQLHIGLGLSYEYENWDFSGVANVAGATPWSKIHRPGISLPIIYTLSEDWQLGFTPAIEFSGESGAEPDKALTYGGALFDGELSIEDAKGNDLASVTYDPSPFLALTFTGRF
jgi:hypothetical protein